MSDLEPKLPSAPRCALPPNAVDCHAHVFGPFDLFPLMPLRSYTPPLAPVAAYRRVLQQLGFTRGVVVQPSAYGLDNRCAEDAVATSNGALRAIGVVASDIDDAELARLVAAGFRGMRFTEQASQSGARFVGAVGFAELEKLGSRLRQHGLHAQIFAKLDDFVAASGSLLQLDVPLVLDHMAGFGPGQRTVNDTAFQSLLGMLREGRVWVKLTAFRNSAQPPHYDDVVAFHDALLRANPDRLIWGSDWPLLNMGDRAPDIGRLLELLFKWVGDDRLLTKILVLNPQVLYRFES